MSAPIERDEIIAGTTVLGGHVQMSDWLARFPERVRVRVASHVAAACEHYIGRKLTISVRLEMAEAISARLRRDPVLMQLLDVTPVL